MYIASVFQENNLTHTFLIFLACTLLQYSKSSKPAVNFPFSWGNSPPVRTSQIKKNLTSHILPLKTSWSIWSCQVKIPHKLLQNTTEQMQEWCTEIKHAIYSCAILFETPLQCASEMEALCSLQSYSSFPSPWRDLQSETNTLGFSAAVCSPKFAAGNFKLIPCTAFPLIIIHRQPWML